MIIENILNWTKEHPALASLIVALVIAIMIA